MGTREQLPTELPPNLSPIEKSGYECFLEVMKWHARAPPPTGLALPLKETDVIVTSFPKSGTTLMQQMCYQIAVLSGGAPPNDRTGLGFSDFNHASPWLEFMPETGIPPCESNPRIFKSHVPVSMFADNLRCRHIVVVRNPLDFTATALDFVFDSVVENAKEKSLAVREAAFDATVHGFILFKSPESELGPWHSHVKKNIGTNDERVMIVCYEDVIENLKDTVRIIARFMGCGLNEEGIDAVVKRCDRNYMASNEAFGMISEADVFSSKGKSFMKAKVKRSTGFKQFHVKDKLLPIIADMNERTFGTSDYDKFRAMIREKQEKYRV